MASLQEVHGFVRSTYEVVDEIPGPLHLLQISLGGRYVEVMPEKELPDSSWVSVCSRIGEIHQVDPRQLLERAGSIPAGNVGIAGDEIILKYQVRMDIFSEAVFEAAIKALVEVANVIDMEIDRGMSLEDQIAAKGNSSNRQPLMDPRSRPLASIDVNESVLREAERCFDGLESAYDTGTVNVTGAIRKLSTTAGAVGPREIAERGLNPEESTRLWRWLDEVGRGAPTGGRPLLPGRILAFTHYWRGQIEPNALVDHLNGYGTGPIPNDLFVKIAQNAEIAMKGIPRETVVIDIPTARVDVGQILGMAEMVIADPGGGIWGGRSA